MNAEVQIFDDAGNLLDTHKFDHESTAHTYFDDYTSKRRTSDYRHRHECKIPVMGIVRLIADPQGEKHLRRELLIHPQTL